MITYKPRPNGSIVGVEGVNVFWYKDHFGPDKLDRPDVIAVIDTNRRANLQG